MYENKTEIQLNKFDNSDYKIGKNAFVRVLWYFTNLLIFNSSWLPNKFMKASVLKLFGANIGKGVVIKPAVNIKYPWKLSIGDYTWIGEGVWIDNLDQVTIGANCCISQGAMLLCGNHDYTKPTFDLVTKPITLENGVWIGAKAVVLPGTIAKSHAILSVASVSPKIMEAYTIYQGNPGIEIRKRNVVSST